MSQALLVIDMINDIVNLLQISSEFLCPPLKAIGAQLKKNVI